MADLSFDLENELSSLKQQLAQREAELAVINSVQEGLASKLELQSIYDLVGEKIHEVFDAQDCMIAVYDKTSDLLSTPFMIERGKRLPSPDPERVSELGMRQWLIRSKKTLVIDRDFEKRMTEEFDSLPMSIMTGWPRSGVVMPILLRDEVVGIVSIYNYDHENAFSDSDVRLLHTLANSMSVALENARLWDQEKLYRKALEREFEIGREIQVGFLPDSLPQPDGWEIAASLKSAREVAGDFYDVFELPNGQIGLVIADVCDKGLGAALFMTLFRSLIRAVSDLDFFARIQASDPISSAVRLSKTISLTNNYIAETHGDTGMFATIFFGILDSNTGVLTYINGGHLPPLIINADGVKEVLKFSGPAVGAIADADYVLKETLIEHSESFFAYTDGLTDTLNPAGEFFSTKELIPLLVNGQSLSPLLTQIQRRVEDHAAGTKQFDDITLLALRRL